MSINISASWGGLAFDADYTKSDYLLTDITGWDGWVGEQWSAPRMTSHGSHMGPVYVRDRQVILTGYCHTPDRRDELFAALSAALSPGAHGGLEQPLTVTFAGRTLTTPAVVRSFDPLTASSLWPGGAFGWKIEMLCASPYRWEVSSQSVTVAMAQDGVGGLEFDLFTTGTTDTGFLEFGPAGSDGLFTLTNPGSVATPPVFIVHGPCGPFVIESQSTGQALMYSGEVLSGQTLTLSDGSVRLDGVDRGVYLTRRQWWTVPPKGSVTGRFTAAGDPSPARLTVTVTGRHL